MAKAKGATTNSIKPIWRSDWKRKKVWNPIEKSSKNLESWRDEWWMHYVYRNYYTSIDMKPFSLKQATIAQVDMEIRRSKNVIVGHICLENCDSHKIHFNLTLPSSWCSGKYVKKTLLLHEKETSSSWRVAFSTYPFRFKTCPLLCFLYIPIKSRNAFHLPNQKWTFSMAQRWFHSLTPKSLSSAKLEPCLQERKTFSWTFPWRNRLCV